METIRHTRTSNFHNEILGDHAVACSQVAVNELSRREVGHTVCNLTGHLNVTAGSQQQVMTITSLQTDHNNRLHRAL